MNNLVNEILKEIIQNSIIKEADASAVQAKETEEVPPIRFPSWFINENLWGKDIDTQDRTLITKIGGAISGENTPIGRAKALQAFLMNAETVKEEITMQEALANLMFLDIFASVVHQFNASVAGFLFEALFAGIFKGEQIEAKEGGGEAGTIDVNLLTADGKIGYSFKLLSPGGSIKGSFTDLITGIETHGLERYLVVIKRGEAGSSLSLEFWEFDITQESWFDWIGHEMLEQTAEGEYTTKKEYILGLKPFQVGDIPLEQEIIVTTKLRDSYTAAQLKKFKLGAQFLARKKEDSPWIVRYGGRLFDEDGKPYPKGTELAPGNNYYYKEVAKERSVRSAKFAKKGAGLYRELMEDTKIRARFEAAKKKSFREYVDDGDYKTDPDFFGWIKQLGTFQGKEKEGEEAATGASEEAESAPASAEQELTETKEAKVKAGQFTVDQQYMINSGKALEGSGTTLTLDRGLLKEAADAYTSVISQQVYDIFNSLSDLIKDINLYYLSENSTERKTAGEQAGEDAGKLKKNTDEHIVAGVGFDEEAWHKSKPPLEGEPGPKHPGAKQENKARQPIDLDKLIEQMINKKFN
tara:strand:- start:55 stop:1800 length:1746 start_codon:yes stop_codon:yes gene_type:complete